MSGAPGASEARPGDGTAGAAHDGWDHPGLTGRQAAALSRAHPGASITADHSWPFGITVLEFTAGGGRFIVKAGETSHHLVREHRAHRAWLAALRGDVAPLVSYDAGAGVLVTRYLPGRIALGTPSALDPDAYRQAGALLRRLHAGNPSGPAPSDAYEATAARRTRAWLDRAGGLAPSGHLAAADAWLRGFVPAPVAVVPTHGDFQPRNWLVRPDGRLALIDFGRADLRPWYTDLVRLEHQELVGRGDLRAALLEGYGPAAGVPRGGLVLEHLMQSLGTIVWARDMGDAAFEEQGRTMLERTVGGLPPG
ncbi:aminoglycoside phosphotransferase family protein [Arthrobacter halodurans]|uniref:Aminoglycoside phosphotransferase family protein n=1 Tax=Arthrobacter halodurans TaxID=516699 RepID=A0ABV4URD3_9MICC